MGLLQDLHGTTTYHSPFTTLGGLARRDTVPWATRIFGNGVYGTKQSPYQEGPLEGRGSYGTVSLESNRYNAPFFATRRTGNCAVARTEMVGPPLPLPPFPPFPPGAATESLHPESKKP